MSGTVWVRWRYSTVEAVNGQGWYVDDVTVGAFSDAVTEIVVGDGAHVTYASIQEWGWGMTHLGVVRAHVGRDAEIRTLSIGFGADLSRVENEVVLGEPGGFSKQLGVFFGDGEQHFDHRSIQDHVAPNCTSDLLYKGALRDASRAVYSGWVHVRPDAQKTEAMQTSRNIVMSDKAKADAIPNLEIEVNDVKCGHAASVGPVDDETIFYLQSRGITRSDAEHLAWFDSEALGRSVALFPLPVVIGIGHEQDVSVLDAVGWRCKTPTAAAALLVDTVRRFLERVENAGASVLDEAGVRLRDEQRRADDRASRLGRAATALLELEKADLRRRRERTSAAALTVLAHAARELRHTAFEIPKAAGRLFENRSVALERSIRQLLQGARRDLAAADRAILDRRAAIGPRAVRLVRAEIERSDGRARRLQLVDPRRVVERGYAILRADEGRLVKGVADAPPGTPVSAELRDGRLRLRSEGTELSGESGGGA